MLPSQSPAIFTVSRLNQTVRLLLEREMGQVWISGEISNFSQPSSGHWYFTLKDDNAQVRCAMFRNSNRRVTFRPQHGQQVLVRANITLYEPRGDYQIIVESMQPAGEGLLQQKYEQLKAQLTAEGLFEQKHKQSLSFTSSRVAAISSRTRSPVLQRIGIALCHCISSYIFAGDNYSPCRASKGNPSVSLRRTVCFNMENSLFH